MSFEDREVRKERTGWRDQKISERHRDWGFNCPAVDLDFLVAEYNLGKPVALIEYKHFLARMPIFNHPTYRALADLADNYGGKGGPLPFLVVFYWPDEWAFRAHPVNTIAQNLFQSPEYFTEQEYVDRLYTMRGWTLQANLKGTLNDVRPKEWPASLATSPKSAETLEVPSDEELIQNSAIEFDLSFPVPQDEKKEEEVILPVQLTSSSAYQKIIETLKQAGQHEVITRWQKNLARSIADFRERRSRR